MKVFTVAGALDAGVITPGQLINCYDGTYEIPGGRPIHDTHPATWHRRQRDGQGRHERHEQGRDGPVTVGIPPGPAAGIHRMLDHRQDVIHRTIRSAITTVGRFVVARTVRGIRDASATTSPSMPRTRPRSSVTSPIAHVPTGW